MSLFGNILSRFHPRNWPWRRGDRHGRPTGPVVPTNPGLPPPVAPSPPPVSPSPPTGPTPGPVVNPTGVGPESPPSSAPWYTQLLSLHNQYRAQQSLPLLKPSVMLNRSAGLYAQALASSGSLNHYLNGSTPGARMSAQGYAWSREGENIAAGQTTPQQVMNDWMGDPGHRQNILGPYQDVGFGLVGNFWVTDFATPLESQGPILNIKAVVGRIQPDSGPPYVQVVPEFTPVGVVAWHPGGIDVRPHHDLEG